MQTRGCPVAWGTLVDPLHFPALELRDLRGRERPSPAVFDGRWNLVFVAFRRGQQKAIDEWVKRLGPLPDGVKVWEVPSLSGVWTMARGMIDGGMAAGVGTRDTQERTLTFYGDLRRITTPLGITRRSVITILLLDATSAVVARAEGSFDQVAADLLLAPARLAEAD